LALAHRDPEMVRYVEQLRTNYAAQPEAEIGAHAVARTGQAMVIPEITEAMVAAGAVTRHRSS
jgi:hypothetical protein